MDTPAQTLPLLVENEQLCIRCGYSLRSLPVAGACPECGTPIERSLRGDMFIYCDPPYVRALAQGSALIIVSLFAFIACVIVEMALPDSQLSQVGLIAGIASFLVSGLFLYGWWKLTTPDRGQLSANKGEKPRRIVRLTGALAVLLLFVSGVLPELIPLDESLVNVFTALETIALGVCLIAGMNYVGWLAPRIPHHKIYTRTITLKRWLIVCIVLGVVAHILIHFMMARFRDVANAADGIAMQAAMNEVITSPLYYVTGGVNFLLVITGLVVFIIYIIQMWSLRRELKRLNREVEALGLYATSTQ